MFKTMGYRQGFLPKYLPFLTPSNSPEVNTKSCAGSYKSFYKAFQRVRRDYQGLSKSAMYKTMGYSPLRLFARNGQF